MKSSNKPTESNNNDDVETSWSAEEAKLDPNKLQDDVQKKIDEQVKEYLLEKEKENFHDNDAKPKPLNTQIKKIGEQIKIFSQSKDSIDNSHWKKLKNDLDILYDLYSGGITQHKVANTIIRDARNIDLNQKKQNKKTLDGVSYAISALNNMQGALTILQNEGKSDDEQKKFINKISESNLFNYVTTKKWDQITQKEWELFNTQIVSQTSQILYDKNIKENKLKEKITFASNLNNLHDDHSNIVTLTKLDDSHTAAESEIMLTTLTSKQKEEFQQIKNNTAEKDCPLWFKILDSDIQKMIKDNVDYFIAENKVLPSQILFMPGLRNAYEKNTQIITHNAHSVDINTIATSKHCGTPAVKIGKFTNQYYSNTSDEDRIKDIKNIEDDMHAENIAQSKNFIHSDKTLALDMLNSNTVFANKEKFIFDQTKKSQGENVINHWLPVNARRNIDAKTHYHDKEIYEIFYDHYIKSNDKSQQLLLKFFSYNEHKGFWSKLLDKVPKVKKILHKISGRYYNAKKAMQDSNDPLIKELFKTKTILEYGLKQNNNKSIEILKHMHNIYALMEKDHQRKAESFITCKSGKDRTGYAELKVSAYTISEYCQKNSIAKNSNSEQDILEKIGNAGHSQYLASINGGSRGAKGLKASAGLLGKADYPVLNPILNKKIAKTNKIKVVG